MKTRRLELALLLMASTAGQVAAQADGVRAHEAQANDDRGLREAADRGDLALLDLVHEGPDERVLEPLRGDRGEDVMLAAIRACPALEAPEACVPRLAELAAGRDPDLAPAASLALWRIASWLDADDLARREAATAPLAAAARSLDAAARRHGRADLARLWELSAAQLRAAIMDGAAEPP